MQVATATGNRCRFKALATGVVRESADRQSLKLLGGELAVGEVTPPRGRLALPCVHTKTFTKGRSMCSRATENGPAFPQSSRVQPRSQEKCQPSSATHSAKTTTTMTGYFSRLACTSTPRPPCASHTHARAGQQAMRQSEVIRQGLRGSALSARAHCCSASSRLAAATWRLRLGESALVPAGV